MWPLVDRLCVLCGCGGQAVCPVCPLVDRVCLCGLWWTGCVSVWHCGVAALMVSRVWALEQACGHWNDDGIGHSEIYRSLWVSEVDDSHTTV